MQDLFAFHEQTPNPPGVHPTTRLDHTTRPPPTGLSTLPHTRLRRSYLLLPKRPLRAEQVVVVLGESVGLVSHVL
jgi:hypothetical protein